MRRLIFAVFFTFFFFSSFPKAHADEAFSTAYDVTYTIMESGVTHASFVISLTNKTSDSYASSYKMNVGFKNIKNVQAVDPEGILSPDVETSNDESTIAVTFRKRVVGIGNTLTFTITFDTADIVQKQGKVWEANIPGIENQNDFASFTVHVKPPPSLGKPTYIKPAQQTNSLDFTKEQLGKGGIAIGFGSEQLYQFTLAYHLKNTHIFPVKTEIALPPSTNYQDVFIENIAPLPLNVRVDEDGNWLAQYSLTPSQKIDVTVVGKARLSLVPKKQPTEDATLAKYLKEAPYWEVNNAEIQQLAKTLKTPYNIYEYIIKSLRYDYSRVTDRKPRLGALKSLKNPSSAVCLEFTDLFVAIARAAGIPAREVNGFAFTQNATQRPLSLVKDILHAWPEYYDKEKQTWVMIDPTWGSTTNGTDYFSILDYDHFAFVVKGVDSEYPVPAGGYKYEETADAKDVNVTFAQAIEEASPTVSVTAMLPDTVIAGFPIKGALVVRNIGSAHFPSQTLTLVSSLVPPVEKTLRIEEIPPFGHMRIPVSFYNTDFLTNTKDTITIRVQQNEFKHSIRIVPFYLTIWFFLGGIFIASITIGVFYITKRFRRLPLSQQSKESIVRGESQKP